MQADLKNDINHHKSGGVIVSDDDARSSTMEYTNRSHEPQAHLETDLFEVEEEVVEIELGPI